MNWDPTRTHLFVICCLEWESEDWKPFPKDSRRDIALIAAFVEKGVPIRNITHLQDEKATLHTVLEELRMTIGRVEDGDFFWFYYAGHGWIAPDRKTYFANYDAASETSSLFSVDTLFDLIAPCRASRIIVSADCCHSGVLCVRAQKSSLPVLALASSHSNSSSTAAWTFSDTLLSALQGHNSVDCDGDGVISMSDLIAVLDVRMAAVEAQMAAAGHSPSWPSDTPLMLATVSDLLRSSFSLLSFHYGSVTLPRLNSYRCRSAAFQHSCFLILFLMKSSSCLVCAVLSMLDSFLYRLFL